MKAQAVGGGELRDKAIGAGIATIGVVGAGTIGAGVAETFAEAGLEVILIERNTAMSADALDRIRRSLRARRLTGPAAGTLDTSLVLSKIRSSTTLEDLGAADFVVENVFEDESLKLAIYHDLDRICRKDCIFAVNTSAIPIARIAAATKRQDRIVGVHFMNPVPMKPTVEVISSSETSEVTLRTTLDLLARVGKQAVVVGDGPGFVSNRVLMLTINEAIGVLQDEVANADAVDRLFRECFGHPMGPLETADLIGLDTILATLAVLHDLTGEAKFLPAPLLKAKVADGKLGRKAGEGFHDYR